MEQNKEMTASESLALITETLNNSRKEILDYLEELNKQIFVMVEYGIESTNDDTLRRINRGHDFETSRRAVEMTAERGIKTGGHIILGLPGETDDEIIKQAPVISGLPLTTLKIHHIVHRTILNLLPDIYNIYVKI